MSISRPHREEGLLKPTPHLRVEPALAWDPGSLVGVGSMAVNKLEKMATEMHAYLADAGVDGVKVDAQAGLGIWAGERGGVGYCACLCAPWAGVKSAFGPTEGTASSQFQRDLPADGRQRCRLRAQAAGRAGQSPSPRGRA
jgi:hypothetical protein